MRIDDFRREYPALGEVTVVETLGGLPMSRLDRVPAPMFRFIHLGLHPLVASVEDVRGKSCTGQAGSGQTRQSGADMSDA
jgi:hypothetical protein